MKGPNLFLFALLILALISTCLGFASDNCKRAKPTIKAWDVSKALQTTTNWRLKVSGKAVIQQFINTKSSAEVITVEIQPFDTKTPNVQATASIVNNEFVIRVSGIASGYYGSGLVYGGCEPHYRITIFIPAGISEKVASKNWAVAVNDLGVVSPRKTSSMSKIVFDTCSVKGSMCPSCCSGNGDCTISGCVCRATHSGAACDKPLDASSYPASKAFDIWTPITPYDTCSKDLHYEYAVIGPDGKRYNTWHPTVHYFADGSNCTFGHEHGQNPVLSRQWTRVASHYSYNAELSHNSGLPFAYANEQLEVLRSEEKKISFSRHEDHVGHKVIWEHEVAIDWSLAPDGSNRPFTGFTCDTLAKFHQGTHSPDAFSNNLHEIQYFVRCNHTTKPDYKAQDLRLTLMASFGKAGQFNAMPCDHKTLGPVFVGYENTNKEYPGSPDTVRSIPTRECADMSWLVAGTDRWSGNFYENWGSTADFYSPSGQQYVYLPLGFAVFNPGRFFDPKSPNGKNMTYTFELCFEKQKRADGRIYETRGGDCEEVKNNYAGWDPKIPKDPYNPKSGFAGNKRETYFKPGIISNPTSTTYFFSDPFGKGVVERSADQKSSPGKILQYISRGNIDYGKEFPGRKDGVPIEPTALGGGTDFGSEGVHLPN